MSPTQSASFNPSQYPYPVGYVTIPGSARAFCIIPLLNLPDPHYAATLAGASRAIASAKSSPVSFSQSFDGFTLQGTFGDWVLAESGERNCPRLSIPVTNWTLTGPRAGSGNFFSCTVDVRLEWAYPPMQWVEPLPGETSSPTASGVVGIPFDYDTNPAEPIQNIYLGLLVKWLQANQPAVQQVFGSVLAYMQQLQAAGPVANN